MFEDKNEGRFDNLKTPQPISIHLDGYFVSLYKGDVEVLKVNQEDTDALFTAITLLNGMLRAGVVFGEIEQMRDILQEIVGS
jgi:hypothetical protein